MGFGLFRGLLEKLAWGRVREDTRSEGVSRVHTFLGLVSGFSFPGLVSRVRGWSASAGWRGAGPGSGWVLLWGRLLSRVISVQRAGASPAPGRLSVHRARITAAPRGTISRTWCAWRRRASAMFSLGARGRLARPVGREVASCENRKRGRLQQRLRDSLSMRHRIPQAQVAPAHACGFRCHIRSQYRSRQSHVQRLRNWQRPRPWHCT
jgi:hypothetical protein